MPRKLSAVVFACGQRRPGTGEQRNKMSHCLRAELIGRRGVGKELIDKIRLTHATADPCAPNSREDWPSRILLRCRYLGAGIGLIASTHCLAAAGGDGLLEMDVNSNPLRELLTQPFPPVASGMLTLPNGAGLGVEPDLDAVERYLVFHRRHE